MLALHVLLAIVVPLWGQRDCPKICYKCQCLLGEPGIDNYTITTTKNHIWGIPYEVFRNIPYAKPPVGNLRFQNPELLVDYPDELDKKPKPLCAQIYLPSWNVSMIGAEDCLYLHVYRPKLNYKETEQNLPVLIYLPLQNLISNIGDPKSIIGGRLMSENVIVVVIQSRVGVLGYLSTGDMYAPGNLGLKDQFLAISWVKAGIQHFGGSPTNITVFGDSSVMYQLLLPKINFQQAIITSNYAFSYFKGVGAQTKQASGALADTLGLRLGYGRMSNLELVERLQKEPLKRIFEVQTDMMNHDHYPFYVFGPTIEKASANSVITSHPTKLWAKIPHNIPILVGYSPYYGEQIIQAIEHDFKCYRKFSMYKAFRRFLQFPKNKTTANDVVLRYGLKKWPFFDIDNENREIFVKLFTHRLFEQPLNKTIRLYNQNEKIKKKRLYVYYMNYSNPFNSQELESLFVPRPMLYPVKIPDEIVYVIGDFVKTGLFPNIDSCRISDTPSPVGRPDRSCPVRLIKKGPEFVIDFLPFESRFLDAENIRLLD